MCHINTMENENASSSEVMGVISIIGFYLVYESRVPFPTCRFGVKSPFALCEIILDSIDIRIISVQNHSVSELYFQILLPIRMAIDIM